MREVIERLLRYAIHFNSLEEFRCNVNVDKTVISVMFVKSGNILIEENIDKLDVKSEEFITKQLELVCEKLHIHKQ